MTEPNIKKKDIIKGYMQRKIGTTGQKNPPQNGRIINLIEAVKQRLGGSNDLETGVI